MGRLENRENIRYGAQADNSIENIAAYELDNYLARNKERCVLIDVRDKMKYEKQHIGGAINIPYRDIQAGEFDISNSKIIVLYCDRGGLSMAAARYLSKQGYNVKNVVGGLKNYLAGKKWK